MAVNPGLICRTFVRIARKLNIDISKLGFETGGEDMPDAYLICPVAEEDLPFNIVELPPGCLGEDRMFIIVYAMLFGFRSSVTNFTRFSVLFQSLGRRLLAVVVSMFYDDASIQDFASAKGAAQKCLGSLLVAIGGSFKAAKQQRMNDSADFLGLVHDVKDAFSKMEMSFAPRPSLITKAVAIAEEALLANRLTPTSAGKLLGMRAFLENGMFARVGNIGIMEAQKHVNW